MSQHQASFAGNLIDFSWNAQVGISANQQPLYEEDEATDKENLSVSIDFTGKVSGSSGWTWTSEDGDDSCAGTTSISGTRNP